MNNIAYKVITDRILELLDKGVVPWKKPWGTPDRQAPMNVASQRQYSGINLFVLNAWGWEDNRFITFKQASHVDGRIKKGSKGCPVIYWNTVKRFIEKKNGVKEEKDIPYLRYYVVFNVAQVEGITWQAPTPIEREFTPIESAERVVSGLHNPPKIYGNANRRNKGQTHCQE